MKRLIEQFIKFGLIGALNTVINYGISNGLYYGISLQWQYWWLVSNLIAFAVCTFIAYLLQRKFVFEQKEQSTAKVLLKSYSVYGFSNGIMENVILGFCLNTLNLPYFIAKLAPMFITIPTNFLLHKFWVFKDGMKEKEGKK